MIGIVIVTHGRLADEMIRTLEGVLGDLVQVAGVSAAPRPDPDSLRADIRHAVERVGGVEGCLILTDMLGDTATNLSLAISHETPCEVVTGVNMPMLVKAVTARSDRTLESFAAFIREYGRDHILWASREPGARQGVRR